MEQLIIKAKQGDKDALVQLVMSQKKEYYKLAYAYMENKEDALDALEDMIVILYDNINKLKKEDAFFSWSKTILANRCKKLLREKNKVVYIDTVEDTACEGEISQKEEQIALERHITQLNAKHQEIIKLRYYLDLDYQNISEILKIPIGTVKSRISIALKKLKESFGGEYYE